MTIPTFLACPFRYLETTGVTAMSSVITQIRSELVTNGGWTEPTSKTFKSPVDPDGRFFTITFLDEAAGEMEVTVKNQFGIDVITRREFLLDTGGTTIRIWSSPYYIFIESDVSGTDSFAIAGMLDLSPEGQASHQGYVYANASYTNAGGADNNFDRYYKLYMIDNGTATMQERIIDYCQSDGTSGPMLTGSGGELYKPVELMATLSGSNNRWAGRMFQALLVDSSVSATTTRSVPIDDSTTGTFKVTSMGIGSSTKRLMIRTA